MLHAEIYVIWHQVETASIHTGVWLSEESALHPSCTATPPNAAQTMAMAWQHEAVQAWQSWDMDMHSSASFGQMCNVWGRESCWHVKLHSSIMQSTLPYQLLT